MHVHYKIYLIQHLSCTFELYMDGGPSFSKHPSYQYYSVSDKQLLTITFSKLDSLLPSLADLSEPGLYVSHFIPFVLLLSSRHATGN